MDDIFAVEPRIVASSHPLAELILCEARLQDDACWPWIVLVPRRAGLSEIEQLSSAERAQLLEEIIHAGHAVRAIGRAVGRPIQKLNVGALGNVVPQLHVHVVGRRADDPAWPGPVWGAGVALPYQSEAAAIAVAAARSALLRQP